MPHPLPIFSQSDYLIQIVARKSHIDWQTEQIKISWLLQSQLIWIYTVCKGRVYQSSAGQRLNLYIQQWSLRGRIVTPCICLFSFQSNQNGLNGSEFPENNNMTTENMFKHEGQDNPILLTWLPDKFQDNWSFGSRKEVQNRFSRWQPSWISNQNDLSYFWSASYPDTSFQVLSQLAFQFRRQSARKIFKRDASWISHQNDSSYFQSTSHLDTSYQV